MEFCARIDYVGIGWYTSSHKVGATTLIPLSFFSRLISASVATVAHYGFSCHPKMKTAFLVLCLSTAVAGSIFPFVKWFNQFEYRVCLSCLRFDHLSLFLSQLYRISFFVALALAGVGPIVALSASYSWREAILFVCKYFQTTVSLGQHPTASILSACIPLVSILHHGPLFLCFSFS